MLFGFEPILISRNLIMHWSKLTSEIHCLLLHPDIN